MAPKTKRRPPVDDIKILHYRTLDYGNYGICSILLWYIPSYGIFLISMVYGIFLIIMGNAGFLSSTVSWKVKEGGAP